MKEGQEKKGDAALFPPHPPTPSPPNPLSHKGRGGAGGAAPTDLVSVGQGYQGVPYSSSVVLFACFAWSNRRWVETWGCWLALGFFWGGFLGLGWAFCRCSQ